MFQQSCDYISCLRETDYVCRQGLRKLLNSYDDHGDTPLISATSKGHLDLCRLLVTEGADVNLPNQLSHQTALLVAIETNNEDIVQFLLENHADVQQTDNVGITPLYVAIRLKSDSIVSSLISHGCDINIGSQDHTPLFYASRIGCLSIVKVSEFPSCKFFLRTKPIV